MSTEIVIETLKVAKSSTFALVMISAAIFLFAISAEFPKYESAIAELTPIVNLNPDGDTYGETGEFELVYGDTAKAASESVYNIISNLGYDVIVSHKMPIDPTGIFIHDLKKDSSLQQWAEFFVDYGPSIGVFIPDHGKLKSQFKDKFIKAFKQRFGSIEGYSKKDVTIDRVSFSINRITGDIRDRTAVSAINADNEVTGLAVIRVTPKVEREDFISPWLDVEIPGRLVVLENFTFTGKVLEELEKHGQQGFAKNLKAGGLTFPNSKPYWSSIGSLTPVEALAFLDSESKKITNAGEISLWGLKIPSKSIAFIAPLIVVSSLLYTLAHLIHLARIKPQISEALNVFGWVVLFSNKVSKTIVVTSVFILPVGALLFLTINTWESLTAIYKGVGVIGVLVAVLAAGRCLYVIRLIRANE